jgi:hypothetical protein
MNKITRAKSNFLPKLEVIFTICIGLWEYTYIINFIGSGFTRSAIEHTIYRTRGERSVHYTTDAYIYLYFLQYVMKKYKLST